MRWLALLFVATCSGGQSISTDAGTTPRMECDPSTTGCPAGQTCDLVCDEFGSKIGCRPAGDVAAGAGCTVSESCAARSGCFATAAAPHSCVPYCRTNADCSQGACRERQVVRNCPGPRIPFTLKFCLP
jgi:hypothetical protein